LAAVRRGARRQQARGAAPAVAATRRQRLQGRALARRPSRSSCPPALLLRSQPLRPTSPKGSYFTLSLFDKLWHPDLTEAEALSMMEKGIEEVRRRLVVAAPKFLVKVVDKDGVRTVAELKA
jgi:hypothetical protein